MSAPAGARAPGLAPVRWAPWLAWALTGVAGALAGAALGAHVRAPGMEPGCVLRSFAHIACPTCGMTRALALLARGDWRAAFVIHPWAPALVAQLAAGWILWGAARARGIGRLDRWLPHLVALNAAALALIWLARLLTGTLPPV